MTILTKFQEERLICNSKLLLTKSKFWLALMEIRAT